MWLHYRQQRERTADMFGHFKQQPVARGGDLVVRIGAPAASKESFLLLNALTTTASFLLDVLPKFTTSLIITRRRPNCF